MTTRTFLLRFARALVIASSCFACSTEPTLAELPVQSPIPFGWLDEPKAGPVSGRTPIRAWALTHVGTIAKVEILIDGTPVDVHFERVASHWACRECPRCEDCGNARYLGEFDFGSISKGEHWLSWRATSNSGEVAELGRRRIVVR